MSLISRLETLASAGRAPEGAWDLSYAYYAPPVISTASPEPNYYVDSKNTSSEGTDTQGFYVRPDGLGFYKADNNNNRVYQYDANNSANAWRIGSANYSTFLGVSNVYGITFKPDGTQFYSTNPTGPTISMQVLSTPWAINTAGAVAASIRTDLLFGISSPEDLQFSTDGTRLYIFSGPTGTNFHEIALSTAWDITTGTYTQGVASGTASMPGFRGDGARSLVAQGSGASQTLLEYEYSTPWDISTASLFNTVTTTSITAGDFGRFRADGKLGWSNTGGTNEQFHQFSFGTFRVFGQDSDMLGMCFSPNGQYIYTVGQTNDSVYQYTLSTYWDTSTATYTRSLSLVGSERNPEAIQFKPDGTKMYIFGDDLTGVSEFSLSTPWDISTATYTTTFDVSAQLPSSHLSLVFKPDGTKMFVGGNNTGVDQIFSYTLSTAWDVSTAVVDAGAFDTGYGFPTGIVFKPSGKTMFVSQRGGDVHEFALSTAWDVSTASLTQSYKPLPYLRYPEDLFFKPDGTQMFILSSIFSEGVIGTFALGVE